MSLSRSAKDILAVPQERLRITQALILDWHDGPVSGFLRFETPPTAWQFELLAEHYEDEDANDRVYLLAEVAVDLWEKTSDILIDQRDDHRIAWVPSWQFESDDELVAAEEAVARLEESAGVPEFLIRLSNSLQVSEIWVIRNGALSLADLQDNKRACIA